MPDNCHCHAFGSRWSSCAVLEVEPSRACVRGRRYASQTLLAVPSPCLRLRWPVSSLVRLPGASVVAVVAVVAVPSLGLSRCLCASLGIVEHRPVGAWCRGGVRGGSGSGSGSTSSVGLARVLIPDSEFGSLLKINGASQIWDWSGSDSHIWDKCELWCIGGHRLVLSQWWDRFGIVHRWELFASEACNLILGGA